MASSGGTYPFFEEDIKFLPRALHEEYRRHLITNPGAIYKPLFRQFYTEKGYDEDANEFQEREKAEMISMAPGGIKIKGAECPRCKGNNTMSMSEQTRRGDEGMTRILKCFTCNRVF